MEKSLVAMRHVLLFIFMLVSSVLVGQTKVVRDHVVARSSLSLGGTAVTTIDTDFAAPTDAQLPTSKAVEDYVARSMGTDSVPNVVVIGDGANLDAFSRLRVSNPIGLFDAQFTYDLKYLLFDTIQSANGTVSYDVTNRDADIELTAANAGEDVFIQSFEYFRYQPGKSQEVLITFNMQGGNANVETYAGYGNSVNGMFFVLNGTTPEFRLLSGTDAGNDTVTQALWNLDPMDGTGKSGIDLDFNTTQILIIDFQALYVGRVRFGFDVNGKVYYCHEFLNANNKEVAYIQTANLPLKVGMKAKSNAASHSMHFICCTVISEGGSEDTHGYSFAVEGTATAASGARTHILSLQPRDLFRNVTNRITPIISSVDILVTGSSPIKWELVIGDVITGTTTFTSVNTNYSGMEYNTLGTTSGSYTAVIASGYVPATNQSKGDVHRNLVSNFPLTLDALGTKRPNGRLSLIVTGIGGSSACRATINWKEVY